MTALPRHHLTVDEFLAWAVRQPKEGRGKLELVDGVVVMQQSERLVHGEIKFGLGVALKAAVDRARKPCFVIPDSAHVRISKSKSYQPDGLMYCGKRADPDVLEIEAPMLVYEVLSPDSISRDHGEKLEGYFTLPSLQHYLIVDPDRRVIIHHRRGNDDEIITRIRKSGTLKLEPPGIEIAVADVFERA